MPANQKRNGAAEKAPRRTRAKVAPEVFDPETFLTTVGAGRTISTFKAKSYIFRQGVACDAVFYILKGNVDLSGSPRRARRESSGNLDKTPSSAKAAWPAIPSTLHRHGPPRRPRWLASIQRR